METRSSTCSMKPAETRTTTTAGARVMRVTELQGLILAQLPYQALSTFRQVSKDWKETIDDSNSLRRLRFLEADPQAGGPPIYIFVHGDLQIPRGHFIPPEVGVTTYCEPAPICYQPRPVLKVLPVLEAREDGRMLWDPVINIKLPWDIKMLLHWNEGSEWEKALITQPPCYDMHLLITDAGGNSAAQAKLHNNLGIRLGDVVARIRQMAWFFRKARIQRETRPRIDVERYHEVYCVVEKAVLPDSKWVKQAEWFKRVRKDLHGEKGATEAAATKAMRDEADDDGVTSVRNYPSTLGTKRKGTPNSESQQEMRLKRRG